MRKEGGSHSGEFKGEGGEDLDPSAGPSNPLYYPPPQLSPVANYQQNLMANMDSREEGLTPPSPPKKDHLFGVSGFSDLSLRGLRLCVSNYEEVLIWGGGNRTTNVSSQPHSSPRGVRGNQAQSCTVSQALR